MRDRLIRSILVKLAHYFSRQLSAGYNHDKSTPRRDGDTKIYRVTEFFMRNHKQSLHALLSEE